MTFMLRETLLQKLLHERIAHAEKMAVACDARAERLGEPLPASRPGATPRDIRAEVLRERDAWLRDAYDARGWLLELDKPRDKFSVPLTRDELRWVRKHLAPESLWPLIGELPNEPRRTAA